MRVTSPPRRDPKARGMRKRDGERLFFLARRMATGMNRASAPTLFMNPDASTTKAVRSASIRVGRPLEMDRSRASWSTMPALVNAWLMTRTAATVITAGWPKPRKALSPGTIPATTTTSRAMTATRSYLHLPWTNKTRARTSVAKTMI